MRKFGFPRAFFQNYRYETVLTRKNASYTVDFAKATTFEFVRR